MGFLFPVVLVAVAAASIENIPTDSWIYSDLDVLKTSGLIRSMPATSRPWTRAEAEVLVREADSISAGQSLGRVQSAALARLRAEFGINSHGLRLRTPLMRIRVPEAGTGAEVRADAFARGRADEDTQAFAAGGVISNRPGDDFAFYERFEFTAWHPRIIEESLPRDSAGKHIPGMRVLPWRNLVTLETELAYLAFRIPWLRLELGRDEFVWGSGYTGSVMLSDNAPSLDHVQLAASFRNFKFFSIVSLLSRWGLKQRLLCAQRVELSLWNRLTLGGALLDVTSWDEFQPSQLGGLLNPLIPVYFTEANTGHGGNFLVGWDGVLYLPRTKLYGQLFLDNYEFNTRKSAPDATASQVGVYWAPSLPVEARAEYTRIMPFTYYHRVHSILYDNYGIPLGHPLGPDADKVLGLVGFTASGWLKLSLTADYTRRGYHNRGDYLRKSFRNPEDTLYLRQHTEFPSLGWDTTAHPDTVIEQVDRTFRLSPGFRIHAFRDLRVSGSVSFWTSQNFQGAIGVDKTGFEFALKVEYRY